LTSQNSGTAECEEIIWKLQQELVALDCCDDNNSSVSTTSRPLCSTLFHLALAWSELINLLSVQSGWSVLSLYIKEKFSQNTNMFYMYKVIKTQRDFVF
jgi:hypothetical protein